MSVPCPSIITDSGNVFYMTSFEEETTRESEGIRSRDRVGAFCGEKVLYRPNYVYEQREGSDTPSVIPMAQYPYVSTHNELHKYYVSFFTTPCAVVIFVLY